MQVTVRSDMAATVVEISVAEGASVQEGDVILILEVMKMELPVPAQRSGVVRTVHVGVGDLVAEDQILVTLDA